jgi:hypothetical protein
MRSRIVGSIALALGVLILATVFFSSQPFSLAPFLGGVLFVVLGGYYLFTGRKAGTLKQYVAEGKLTDDKNGQPEEKS